jgi:hypothetical protein
MAVSSTVNMLLVAFIVFIHVASVVRGRGKPGPERSGLRTGGMTREGI